jgi:hypothetical protein
MFRKVEWAIILLGTCKFSHTRTRDAAVRAVELLEQAHAEFKVGETFDPEGYHLSPRGLVYYADLLKRYIALIAIDKHDLKSMICRCVEFQNSENGSLESLKLLLDYHDRVNGGSLLEILLLPGKYKINIDRYDLCRSHNVRDTYFEDSGGVEGNVARVGTYHHPLVETDHYFGFRNAYHALLYRGTVSLAPLIKRWEDCGADCTTEAALQFYEIPYDENTYVRLYQKEFHDTLTMLMLQ